MLIKGLRALSCILGLSFVIAAHELGHFAGAKIIGVTVDEFAVGFGPVVYSVIIGETQYSLRAFPLGGFNSLAGYDTAKVLAQNAEMRKYLEQEYPERVRALTNPQRWLEKQSKASQFLLVVLGPVASLGFGLVLLASMLGSKGRVEGIADKGPLSLSQLITLVVFDSQRNFYRFLFWKPVSGVFVGPIGFMKLTYEMSGMGLSPFVVFLGFASIGIGAMNLVPVFLLDGWQLMQLLVVSVCQHVLGVSHELTARVTRNLNLFLFIGLCAAFFHKRRYDRSLKTSA